MNVTPAYFRVSVDPPAERLDMAVISDYATVGAWLGRKDIQPAPASTAAAVERLPSDPPIRWNRHCANRWCVGVPLVTEVVGDEVVRTADGVGRC